MTREEAIKCIKVIESEYNREYSNTDISDVVSIDIDSVDIEALDMAIKALESKDVLDKIIAEIYRKAHSGQWSDATMYGMLKAVAIIDKHRAESEDNA